MFIFFETTKIEREKTMIKGLKKVKKIAATIAAATTVVINVHNLLKQDKDEDEE